MGEALKLEYLAKYPFLTESQEYVKGRIKDLKAFLETGYGRIVLNHGAERVKAAIAFRGTPTRERKVSLERSLFGYAIARVIVSCIGERELIDRLGRYEAVRAISFFIDEEDEQIRRIVARQLGFELDDLEMPVTRFVELAASMRGEGWRLVNRTIRRGRVCLKREELVELMREQIRQNIQRQLPLSVGQELCEKLAPVKQEILRIMQEHTLEQFGDVQEVAFPPCMQRLLDAITSGKNLPHQGRFALTAFLHTIGLSNAEIVEIYKRAPDFDISKTTYQVDHIGGSRGTEYTPPSCATMKTYGLCLSKDELCERIGHPLTYYIRKKDSGKRKGLHSRGAPAEDPACTTHDGDIYDEREGVTDSGFREHG